MQLLSRADQSLSGHLLPFPYSPHDYGVADLCGTSWELIAVLMLFPLNSSLPCGGDQVSRASYFMISVDLLIGCQKTAARLLRTHLTACLQVTKHQLDAQKELEARMKEEEIREKMMAAKREVRGLGDLLFLPCFSLRMGAPPACHVITDTHMLLRAQVVHTIDLIVGKDGQEACCRWTAVGPRRCSARLLNEPDA